MSIIAIIATIIILANYSERTVTNIIQLNKISEGKASESWTWGVTAVLDEQRYSNNKWKGKYAEMLKHQNVLGIIAKTKLLV